MPWMRVHDLYPQINASDQERDPHSVLSFYKQMLRLRKEHKDVFVYGAFELLDPECKETFVYRKRYEAKIAVVVLSFSTEVQALPDGGIEGMKMLISSYGKESGAELQPLEGRVYVNY
jgi:alpha-glucosidase